jgi:hypothetical protein
MEINGKIIFESAIVLDNGTVVLFVTSNTSDKKYIILKMIPPGEGRFI